MKNFREEKCNIDFDVFGYRVQVIFTTDMQRSRDKYNTILGFSKNMTGAGAMHTFIDPDMDNRSFIFFKWNADAEQIAHESWHAIRRLIMWAGLGYDNEVVAYHLGHLAGNIHRFQKHISKKK
jgi:hypothetical protein